MNKLDIEKLRNAVTEKDIGNDWMPCEKYLYKLFTVDLEKNMLRVHKHNQLCVPREKQ